MKLTILMYHKVDELHPGARYPGNYVTPAQFSHQLDALLDWGYRSIQLGEWLDYREGRTRALPAKPLVVTFDDGYTCFDRNAWPALKSRAMYATVFLVAGQVGGTNAWDRDEVQEPLLDEARIRALHDDGVQFGSHSVTHPALTRISPARALEELTQSRALLREILGREVDVFAYPFSNQNRAVRQLARRAGYRCAVRGGGRMNSRHTDPFGLRRIKVDLETSITRLRRTLMRERYFRLL